MPDPFKEVEALRKELSTERAALREMCEAVSRGYAPSIKAREILKRLEGSDE
jgi:hypothetical protein